jgi:motility quorum-sensing regulator/GCU-specific mRNA interferase toxin
MEKRKPHYPLAEIKAGVAACGADAFTATALAGGYAMGLDLAGMVKAVVGLSGRCFVKSMTTHIDHRLWQDVYHAETPAGTAYVKFTLRTDGSIVISFKRL